MLSEAQLKQVKEFISAFSSEEQLWLSGYLAGINNNVKSNGHSVVSTKVTVAYGTETGNAKKIAALFAARAKQKKINAKVVSLEQYKLSELEKEEYFFAIVSTHGDGEPPAAAKKFYDHIHAIQQLPPTLNYSVLALGDSAYPLFCKTGEDIDVRLEQLGAKRIAERRNCDVDYETESNWWIENILQQLSVSQQNNVAVIPQKKQATGRVVYSGKISLNVNLNDSGSSKETHHIEITPDIEVDFAPGDSLGVFPENEEGDVKTILQLLQASGDETINFKESQQTLYQLLKKQLHVGLLPQRVINKYAALLNQEKSIDGRFDLIDLLHKFPLYPSTENLQLLINLLEPLAPRLYSIASSGTAHNGELHLTVARSSYIKDGTKRYGLASNYLSQLKEDTSIRFYIQKNNLFRLPADDKDIIMIGPGTGVAPFRAFVAERDARGAEGRNWLFFGDQHFKTDFLYQTEWQNYLETGVLTRLDVAFSRDSEQKVYVQHKMLKHANELFNWLEAGAYFYVCGSKDPMSVDVEKALIEIIASQSKKGDDFALEYLNAMKEEGRYLKDVY